MCLTSRRGILRRDYMLCSFCTLDNFAEYFVLSRNGSVLYFTFHTYDKYHTRVVRTYDWQIPYLPCVWNELRLLLLKVRRARAWVGSRTVIEWTLVVSWTVFEGCCRTDLCCWVTLSPVTPAAILVSLRTSPATPRDISTCKSTVSVASAAASCV